MNRIIICLIIFFITVFTGKVYSSVKKENIAVLDFKLKNINTDAGNIVRNRIEYTLFQTRKFNLLERNRIDLLKQEKNLSGSNTESGYKSDMLLAADYVITGDITRQGNIHLNLVLVDTSSGEILCSFSKKYNSETDLISDADSIASDITDEILFSREFDKNRDEQLLSSNFFLNMGASYIPGTDKLSDFSDNGYMVVLNAGIRNVVLSGVRMGFQAGYAHIYTAGDINYISIAPFQYTVSYEFQPYRKYFFNFGIGFGTAQVTVNKNEDLMREFEACGLLFLELKYHIKSDLAFIIYGNQYRLFENEGDVDFSGFGGGFETLF